MFRRLTSLLLILLAGLLAWQVWQARAQQSSDFDTELAQADRKIRTMVMTQDLGYLRRQALDLHKAYWDLRKEAAKKASTDAWILGGCSVLLLGLGTFSLVRRKM